MYMCHNGFAIVFTDTGEDAKKMADDALNYWRTGARECGVWDERAELVMWGEVKGIAGQYSRSDETDSVDYVLIDAPRKTVLEVSDE